MIKPRLRLFVCASAVVVTIAGSVLTQAAGPGEFISRLWNREPAPKKEKITSITSGISPFKWLRRNSSTVGQVEISDGGRHVVSKRPGLMSDPFLNEQLPVRSSQSQASRPATQESKGAIVRPQIRQQPATTQTVDIGPSSSRRSSNQFTDAVERAQISDLNSTGSSSRAAAVARQSLPEIYSRAQTKSPGNRQFVDGFDNEFQKLFKEVIEESRQSKESPATPRLPDEAVADFDPPGLARISDSGTSDSDQPTGSSAEFSPERSSRDVSNLIQESRSQLQDSVLAQRAASDTGSAGPIRAGLTGLSTTTTETILNTQNKVASAPRLNSRQNAQPFPERSDSNARPQMLPDQSAETVNQLVVPSSIVPERRLFTTAEGWMNRGELERHVAAENAPEPDLKPVVRVVPGNRGTGLVIESGQWSPIKPRVSSNVAPPRSVPDTSEFRRLSHEGSNTNLGSGAVQAIGEDISQPGTSSNNIQQNSNSELMILPADSERSSVPSSLSNEAHFASNDNTSVMIIPDSRTGQSPHTEKSFDAAELGATMAVAPAPPETDRAASNDHSANLAAFDWPDETEIAAVSDEGGFSWGYTMFFLALAGGSIGLFFRRKAQDSAFVITGTSSESEIS